MSVSKFIEDNYSICTNKNKIYLIDLKNEYINWLETFNIKNKVISSKVFYQDLINIGLFNSNENIPRDTKGYFTNNICKKITNPTITKEKSIELDVINKHIFDLNENILKLNQNMSQMYQVILQLRQEVASLKNKPKHDMETSISPRNRGVDMETSISPRNRGIDMETSISPRNRGIDMETSISPRNRGVDIQTSISPRNREVDTQYSPRKSPSPRNKNIDYGNILNNAPPIIPPVKKQRGRPPLKILSLI
jgi:hypothetical protein